MGNSQPTGIAYFNPLISNGIKGTLKFTAAQGGGTEISIKLSGFAPEAVHALHIHEFGDLTQGCKSCGGHFNPDNTTHGSYLYPERPRHAGDLVNNVKSDKYGQVCMRFKTRMFRVQEIVGRSVVLHRKADDLGLKGMKRGDSFVAYSRMDRTTLVRLVTSRGYFSRENVQSMPTEKMIHKMNSESLKTGNAGSRMGCAVIGRRD